MITPHEGSASEIGCVEDQINAERLLVTNRAFDLGAKAIDQQTRADHTDINHDGLVTAIVIMPLGVIHPETLKYGFKQFHKVRAERLRRKSKKMLSILHM